jgi:hypothetical protein
MHARDRSAFDEHARHSISPQELWYGRRHDKTFTASNERKTRVDDRKPELLRRNMLYLVRWLAPKRPVAQKIKVPGKL